eukprot:NODE_39_length_29903_cov_0.529057.p14 type:complete len:160 gc:universal NODE_39_length_29903_cov_0.529057:1369-890(-)
MSDFRELACGDRVVTFLKLKAYSAKMLVDEKCKREYDKITSCPVRVIIEPSRNSSFKHLRDGLCNGLANQSQKSPFEDHALESFKKLFPAGILNGGDQIIFEKNEDMLCLAIKDRNCGCVKDEWLATAFMNLYFSKEHSVVPTAQKAAEQVYNKTNKSE